MFFDGFPNPNGPVDVQTFTHVSTVTNVQWMTWRKPAGKTMAASAGVARGVPYTATTLMGTATVTPVTGAVLTHSLVSEVGYA